MKKIRILLLTLVLSISMLAPELSVIPAVYAEDETQAVEQINDDSETAAEEEGSVDGTSLQPQDGDGEDRGGAEVPDDFDTVGEPAGDNVEEDGIEDGEKAGNEGNDPEEAGDTEDPEEPAYPDYEFGPYDKLFFTQLDEAGAIALPGDVPESIKLSHSSHGGSVLVEGKISDINQFRLSIGETFDFAEGSVGRLSFDGLRDKDLGMKVYVQVFLDDSEEPVSEFPLKKQMGKYEWSNDGEQSVNLGGGEITGPHTVSLGFRVSGKEETKKTTIAIRSMQFCKTTVPVMYFNIDETEGTIEAMNSSDDHSAECYGTVDLIVPDVFNNDPVFIDEYKEYGRQSSMEGLELEYIRGRGNSTWTEEKKPYKVKFADGQDLFGFGENKHWVLLANRFDNSLIRNRMTYWLGRELAKTDPGMAYTPQCVPVEVVMNGDFYGSYLLCEQIRIGSGRVEIDDLDKVKKDSPAITDEVIRSGGYLLSLEYQGEEDRTFHTDNGMRLYVESPEDNAPYFIDYIKAYAQKVENAIFSDNFKDAEGHHYTDYLDLESAVDYWWVQEFSENGDAFGNSSTYLYKKRDTENEDESVTGGKLYWGPLWDFDYVAWGDLDYDREPDDTLEYTGSVWFDAMKGDPVFVERLKDRYLEEGGLREKIAEITREGGLLDKYTEQMETSYEYDHARWGAFNSSITEYSGEVEQLRDWIIKRTEYVDEAISEFTVQTFTVRFVVDGEEIKSIVRRGRLTANDFPELSEREDMVFFGWEDEEGYPYDIGSMLTEDVTLHAHFERKDSLEWPKKIYFRSYEAYCEYPNPDDYEDDTSFCMPLRVSPDTSYNDGISWNSSDESIATVDNEGYVTVHSLGDVTITASLSNGVSNSYLLHSVKSSDIDFCEGVTLNKTKLTLKQGEEEQLIASSFPQPCYDAEILWLSANENIAVVDEIGVVTAVAPGTTDILLVDIERRVVSKCTVTVPGKAASNVGKTFKYKGSTYKITADKSGNRTAALIKAKNAKSVTVPAAVKYGGVKYSVNRIQSKAFRKSKAKKLTVKTKKLTKKSVKGSLKGSKVKNVKVKVGKKKDNKKYVKKYKKIFTKKNAGRKVKVS